MFVLAVDEGKRLCAPKLDLCCRVRLGRSSMNVKVLATVKFTHTHRLLRVVSEVLWIPRNVSGIRRGLL